MVKYNWEEEELKRLGILKPKKFKRESRKQIKDNTLNYLKRFGRRNWVPVGEIFRETLKETDLFHSLGGNFWFSSQGIKSKINSATNSLRRESYPIISGKGHQGYKYADWSCDDVVDVWDEKFSGWEGRKQGLITEFNLDRKLLKQTIKELEKRKKKEKAKKLQKVLVKYTKERKKIEE